MQFGFVLYVLYASAQTGLTVGEFTASPVYPSETNRAGLELAIEFESFPSTDALRAFGDAFDRAIRAENVDYNTKRSDDLGMAFPTITALPMGTFHRWLDRKGKLGGQHKCPRCANHREIIAEVIDAADLAGTR